METVAVFWDPAGFELDSLGKKRHVPPPWDGDTPYVRIPIRMLSIDTPETNYPGLGKPSKSDAMLQELAKWIRQGDSPVADGLAQHLVPRLETGSAGSLQEKHGEKAKTEFAKLLDETLTRPSGPKRNVFLRAADEHFDAYGRLLAYMAPAYTEKELASRPLHERATFNLLMVESGWAATFPIFPSLPKYEDLVRLHEVATKAIDTGAGAWADADLMLTGYEWRMCIKLHRVTRKLVRGESISSSEKRSWISRYCLDMTTLEIFRPQDYHRVPPANRVFVWPRDVRRAVAELNLIPGS
jgi:endonuclease YncB( thermonuclease family)